MINFVTTFFDVINTGKTEGWYWCSIREDKDIQLQGKYILMVYYHLSMFVNIQNKF